jgi:hypothetical protein
LPVPRLREESDDGHVRGRRSVREVVWAGENPNVRIDADHCFVESVIIAGAVAPCSDHNGATAVIAGIVGGAARVSVVINAERHMNDLLRRQLKTLSEPVTLVRREHQEAVNRSNRSR